MSTARVHDWEPLLQEFEVAVAQLGEESWEMASFSVVDGSRTCWFKRPIED